MLVLYCISTPIYLLIQSKILLYYPLKKLVSVFWTLLFFCHQLSLSYIFPERITSSVNFGGHYAVTLCCLPLISVRFFSVFALPWTVFDLVRFWQVRFPRAMLPSTVCHFSSANLIGLLVRYVNIRLYLNLKDKASELFLLHMWNLRIEVLHEHVTSHTR